MKHIWFSLSGVRFHCYRQHLCSAYSLTSQTKDIEELWTHRTNENHTVFMVWEHKDYFIGLGSDHCLPLQLTGWLTNSYFSKLDWCGSSLWRCQLQTCCFINCIKYKNEKCKNIKSNNRLLGVFFSCLAFSHRMISTALSMQMLSRFSVANQKSGIQIC